MVFSALAPSNISEPPLDMPDYGGLMEMPEYGGLMELSDHFKADQSTGPSTPSRAQPDLSTLPSPPPATPPKVTPFKPAVINQSQQLFGQFIAHDEAEVEENGKKKNTAQAYDAKMEEFRCYCDFFYQQHSLETRYTIRKDKVEAFLTYCLLREHKPRGKRKRGTGGTVLLDYEKANLIITTFAGAERDDVTGMVTAETKEKFATLQPKHGVGYSYLNTTIAALKTMWSRQRRTGINNFSEDQVFGPYIKWILKQAKTRKHVQDKKNYVEKIDKASAPLAAVNQVKQLEQYLFNKAITKHHPRIVFSSLRDRMLFLFSCKGILRGDCLYKAELSDCFHLEVAREDDAHPLMVFILQFANCKTNDGVKLFGRVARHIDPTSCAIGSIALYLLYRFHVTKEMDHDVINFFDNASWFDIKFITEIRSQNMSKSINNKTYYTSIKKACEVLEIPSAHFVHLGRVLGSCESEINEDSSEDLRFLGTWDPKVQEQRYSTKVPMKIIRSKAGLRKANGLNYNPRTALIVPDRLRHQVFPWLKEARESFLAEKSRSGEFVTARCFLHMMDEMQTVAIQDAAAMVLQHPERYEHGIFSLPVFQSPEFKEYMSRMKEHLEESTAPYDTSLEQVLQGVQSRFDTLNSNVGLVKRAVNQLMQDSERQGAAIEAMPFSVARLNERGLATLLERVLAAGSLAASPRSRADELATVRNIKNTPLPATRGEAIVLDAKRHQLPVLAKSARDLWNAWYGLGTYKNVPVEGGISQMEKTDKTWRKGSTNAERKKFSRWKQAIDCMLEELGDKTDVVTFLDGMDKLFQESKTKTVSPFLTALKNRKMERVGLADGSFVGESEGAPVGAEDRAELDSEGGMAWM